MFYRYYLFILVILIFNNCTTVDETKNKLNFTIKDNYTNKGFALIYSEKLYTDKIISKKLDQRSLMIFQKNLKKNTQVKITNLLNNKSLIAKVGAKANYPSFNNAIISSRIAKELGIDIVETYIQITAISENSLFVAKKAKTYEEEKKVAIKVPVNSVSINNLNEIKTLNKKNLNRTFSYIIKIADFYFKDTATIMIKRINDETLITKSKIEKISDNKYRVYLGPYDNINALQNSYNDINILGFENIEIIKND